MDSLIKKLVIQHTQATSGQLANIIQHIASAPFVDDLLEVDPPLWGSFWQGDVIAPGHRLPAVELALLRAIRLDNHWPEETTVLDFLADLRQAVLHPLAGMWTLAVAGQPSVVLAAPQLTQRSKVSDADMVTVTWYCASTGKLHAGYRTAVEGLHLAGAIKQRRLELSGKHSPILFQPDWITQSLAQTDENDPGLDAAILRIRAGL